MIKEVLEVKTTTRQDFIEITERIRRVVDQRSYKDGVVTLYVPHTTAGLMINENADPDVIRDIIMWFDRSVPDKLPYRHFEGNSPAHIKSLLTGNTLQLGVEEGKLLLGTWQGIFFCEFDGPRTRQIWVLI